MWKFFGHLRTEGIEPLGIVERDAADVAIRFENNFFSHIEISNGTYLSLQAYSHWNPSLQFPTRVSINGRFMDTLLIEKKGPIATIWLNRLEVRNAFNEKLISELTGIFSALPQDPETRVVILGGKGSVFSTGADLKWMRSMAGADEKQNYEESLKTAQLLEMINNIPQVTIARVHGAAMGGGLGLISVCDIVVAADDTKFGFSEVKIGLIPAIISNFVVPKIGYSWARRYFVSGDLFDAKRAREIGLIHEIVEEDKLDETVNNMAQRLLGAGPIAVSECKVLLQRVWPEPSGDTLKETSEWTARLRVSAEGQEGLTAFLEKRKPGWAIKE